LIERLDYLDFPLKDETIMDFSEDDGIRRDALVVHGQVASRPQPADWDQYKEIIMNLYGKQGMRLKTVAATMAQKLGFIARYSTFGLFWGLFSPIT
jgi:hypothetical protein